MRVPWPQVPLWAVSTEAQTGPFGSQLHSDDYVQDEIPVINPSNIMDGRLIPNRAITVDEPTARRLSRHRLALGDLLFARRGELGRAAVVKKVEAGWLCGTGSLRIRLRPYAFNQSFVGYVLQSARTRSYFESVAVGTTMDNLNTAIVSRLPVPLPPMQDQRRIAAFLDAKTMLIDALITKKRCLIGLLNERSVSVIASAFGIETGLSAASIPNSVGRHPMVRLGAVATVQSGLTLDAGRDLDSLAVTCPYLRVANVQDGRIDLSEVKEVSVPQMVASRCKLRAGDVLMTEGGDPDKLGRGTVWHAEVPECLHQNHIFAVRPTSALLPEFLALLSRTPYARAYFEVTASKTTGIASTSTSKIASFRIPLPPIEEQRQLVCSTMGRMSTITRTIESIDRQVILLREHRQALITAAVTGELPIPECVG